MSAYTPGPLAADECPFSDKGFKTVVVVPGKFGQFGTVVADCAHNWQEAAHGERRISWKEAEANALLFAGAGELLEALEYAVEKYGKSGGPWNVPSDPGGWLERARAAIAKARGQS